MAENLRMKTMSGMKWGYINRFGGQLVGLCTSMVLARLIAPEEYGLLAMTAIFQGFASLFSDVGFSSALIQKKDTDRLDYSTVFWTNLLLCILSAAILIIFAPYGADYFNDQRITSILQVSALTIPISAVGGIQQTLFTKNLEFRKVAIRNIGVQVTSAIFGIVLAFSDFGVWTLVYQGVFSTTASVIVNWTFSSWHPEFIFSFKRLKPLFDYGSKMYMSSILDFGFGKMYDFVIAKFYSPTQLALYNRSNSTAEIFKGTFYNVLEGITFPVFVKMQDDDIRLRLNVRKFMMITTMIISFVMLTVIALSEPIFRLLYSSRWDEAIPYFKLSCLIAMLIPLHAINLSILRAKGRTDLFLQLEVIKKTTIIVVMLLSYSHGVMVLLYGVLFHSILCLFVNTYYTKRIINYSVSDQFHDLWPYFLSSAFIAAIVYGIDWLTVDRILTLPLLQLETSDHLLNGLIAQMHNSVRILIGVVVSCLLFIWYHRTQNTYAYSEAIQFLMDTMGDNRIFKLLIGPARRPREN